MAIIKYKDISKINEKERNDKILELKRELVKSNVASQKSNAKSKEIKRAIARILTFNKSVKEELKNKK